MARKQNTLEARILAMKRLESFELSNKSQREQACRIIGILDRAGLLKVTIRTFENNDGKFTVGAFEK